MSSDTFFYHLKSTLDYVINKAAEDIATELDITLQVVDLADISGNDDALKSNKTCILFELLAFDPSPQHPLYTVSLVVGAKTGTQDLGGTT